MAVEFNSSNPELISEAFRAEIIIESIWNIIVLRLCVEYISRYRLLLQLPDLYCLDKLFLCYDIFIVAVTHVTTGTY